MLTVTGFRRLRLYKVTAYWIRLLGFHSDKLLEERSSRTPEEQDLFMQLSPLYLEKIATAEQVGEQRGQREVVLLLLAQKFDPFQTELKTKIEALNVEHFQSLTNSLFQFASIADLSNWLDRL
jgi:Domain of unknown function (DUF4351)